MRTKKLVLEKETVRTLQNPELRAIVGGGFGTTNLITITINLAEQSLAHDCTATWHTTGPDTLAGSPVALVGCA
jgi:hypothetical protein